MKSILSVSLIILAVTGFTYSSDIPFFGQCPSPRPGQSFGFDVNRFLGSWYEIKSSSPVFRCPMINYGLLGNGYLNANYSGIGPNDEYDSVSVTQKTVYSDIPNYFEVTPVLGDDAVSFTVLETDYETYAVVFSCAQVDRNYFQVDGWIYARDTTLDATLIKNLSRLLRTKGVFILKDSDRTDCDMPTPTEPSPTTTPTTTTTATTTTTTTTTESTITA